MPDSPPNDETRFKAVLSTLVHDLHQPFAIISGYTELLSNDLKIDELNRAQLIEYAEHIENGVKKMGIALKTVREILKGVSP